jgi:hypothetical protein
MLQVKVIDTGEVSIGNLTNQTKPNVQGRPSLTIQPIAARTLIKWLFLSSVYGKPGDAPKHLFMKCHFAKANQNYSWPLDNRANTSSLLPQNWEVDASLLDSYVTTTAMVVISGPFGKRGA